MAGMETKDRKLYTMLVYSENIAGILNQITAVFTRRQVNIEKSECVSLKHRGCSQVHHNGMERRRPDKNNNKAYREENRCDKG